MIHTRATTRQLLANIATSSNTLHDRAKYGMIAVYLNHGNGGHNVNVGILNSRGGGSKTEEIDVYRDPANQERAARSLQSQRNVADHACRLTAVSRCSEEYQITGSGKLIFAFSAATRHSAIPWNRLTERRCQSLLRVHSMTLPYGKSREWYGAAWEGIPQ